MSGKHRLWPILLASFLGLVILCGLGTWQLKRLAWKNALTQTLNARMQQEAVPLAEALKRLNAHEDIEYLKVYAKGELDAPHTLYKQTVFYGQSGWEGIAPFRSNDGTEVLVDLGATDQHGLVPKPVPEITGIVRMHNLGRGHFDNSNSPQSNMWFWWDLPAMRKAAGMNETAAPIILQAFGNESGFQAALPKVELRNNHLGYAITWFGLALALAGVSIAFLLKRPEA